MATSSDRRAGAKSSADFLSLVIAWVRFWWFQKTRKGVVDVL